LIEQIDRSAVLVTGASGMVGGGLVRALRRSQPDRQIVILTRRPESIPARANIAAVRADLRKEDLGIDPAATQVLRTRITEVIHCAADLKFTASLESAREINVHGTRRVLDFARRCLHLEKVAHVSTLYIAGRRPGIVLEEPLDHDCGYFNVYEQSKHEAEHLVVNRMRELPVSIYRLSSLIGHSTTGKVSQYNYFHALVRLLPRAGEVATLPGDPDAPMDLIPDDWCVSALAYLYQRHFLPGRIHHLCAGPERSLSAGQLLDLVFHVYNSKCPRAVPQPRLTPLPGLSEIGNSHFGLPEGPLFDLLSKFLPHLAIPQPFDRGNTGAVLVAHGINLPAMKLFIERVVQQTIPT
jgi:nucleoside-diphosphate-sugar epimerase